MIKKVSISNINNLLINKQSFIVCTYYIDSFSMFYTSKINKELNKMKLDIYYIEVESFMKLFNLNKRIFPIFCFINKGIVVWITCGFLSFDELMFKVEQKGILIS